MIATVEKQVEQFEDSSPESLAATVEQYEGRLYYTLRKPLVYRDVFFDISYSAHYKDGCWNCRNRITWRSGEVSGEVRIEDFEYSVKDRRKVTIEALKVAMGTHAYGVLTGLCSESGVKALLEEGRSLQREREQLQDKIKAENEAANEVYLAWLDGLLETGQVVAGVGVGTRLNLVLTELVTVAGVRMRSRVYDVRFAYDGVTLEFMKGGDLTTGKPKVQVRINLKGFGETTYADQDGTRVIGKRLSYRGASLPYTWVIPPDRLQQIETVLMELGRHDRLVDIMTNGRKEDRCICCRKALTDPVSRARWVGPECTKHFQGVCEFEDDGTQTRLLN